MTQRNLWYHLYRYPSQPVVHSVQPIILLIPQVQQIGPIPLFGLSHFKPEFSCRPDEDAEAHLRKTNDLMHTHVFLDSVKI